MPVFFCKHLRKLILNRTIFILHNTEIYSIHVTYFTETILVQVVSKSRQTKVRICTLLLAQNILPYSKTD